MKLFIYFIIIILSHKYILSHSIFKIFNLFSINSNKIKMLLNMTKTNYTNIIYNKNKTNFIKEIKNNINIKYTFNNNYSYNDIFNNCILYNLLIY
jgi:hypothetical protein